MASPGHELTATVRSRCYEALRIVQSGVPRHIAQLSYELARALRLSSSMLPVRRRRTSDEQARSHTDDQRDRHHKQGTEERRFRDHQEDDT